MIGVDKQLLEKTIFNLVNIVTGKTEFTATLGKPQRINEWVPEKIFCRADFSSFKKTGTYQLTINIEGSLYHSYHFVIEEKALAKLTIPSILNYYRKQGANTSRELVADKHMQLYESKKAVDVRGGRCDASGDVSKYFSHLVYANFMSPQQTPLVTWSLSIHQRLFLNCLKNGT